jgi:membrane protein
MREFPRGGLIGKTVHLVRTVTGLRVPLYAANACYFIVIALFPALLLLLGLLRYTPLEVERLGEMLAGILPEALLAGAEELILLTYDNASATAVGLSAVTTLWSASRGIYGLLTGLNRVYGVTEDRGYWRTRALSVVYTFGFLVVLLLTLVLGVFGEEILAMLPPARGALGRFLDEIIDLRFLWMLLLQTSLFTAMYTVLPNRKGSFRQSFPGAVLACLGWQLLTRLFSFYVAHFSRYASIYGSVYAVALAMLWLYFCLSILFYGGALNRLLAEGEG